ncbi:RHS repeat-associated core domain-containing protein [Pseudomonas sp. NPDC089407]|uniref:RHS repeat-associated core domain-containing protein n=1 Tax=Pseudomonas sp. NPDC089407 TaxID=3364464 RepID=UPI00384D3E01
MTNQIANDIGPSHAFLQEQGSSSQHRSIHFYQNDYLSARFSEQGNHRVLWAEGTPIVQFEEGQIAKTLKVDQASSVLGLAHDMVAYSPYGFLKSEKITALIAFNGQCFELLSQAYALGIGYRFFSPVRLRFNSPDSFSPFGRGDLNAYAYCKNDPVNFTDPSGHFSIFQGVQRAINSRRRPQTYIKDIHPTKLYSKKSELTLQAKTFKKAIQRDTRGLAAQRRELPHLEHAAINAERKNTPLIADSNEWADARRVDAMNHRLALKAQQAKSNLLAAQNHEVFLSKNTILQTIELDKTNQNIRKEQKSIEKFVSLGL